MTPLISNKNWVTQNEFHSSKKYLSKKQFLDVIRNILDFSLRDD